MSQPFKPIGAPALTITSPSPHPGMGAQPVAAGTSFRVWAPHAAAVFVAGDFNAWQPDTLPLAAEDDGYWSAFLPGVGPGAHYKFRLVAGGRDLWRIDPYARAVTHSAGDGIVVDPAFDWHAAGFQMPAWNTLVIYELHVGTFNAPHGRLPATFDDAAARLPYLRDLGVTAVELLPPMEYPGDLSWGYNPSHLFAVEHGYGGPAALKRFVDAAHGLGIAVILDVVYNHAGPSDLSLWRFDGWHAGDGGGIYFYNDERAATPWGDTRFDYGRGEVRRFLRDNALMWLDECHVDGLRFDATASIRNITGTNDPATDLPDGWRFLQWMNDEIRARRPGKFTIAEDLQGLAALAQPVDQGGAGFDAQWDGGFVYYVRAALSAVADEHRDIDAVADAIARRPNDDAFRRVIYTESHDEVANGKVRVPVEIAGDAANPFAKKRSTLGAALALTAPGIPMLFQGQEFLTAASFDDGAPLDWSRLESERGIVTLYRDLIALRRNLRGTTRGLAGQFAAVYHRNAAANVLAFHRWDRGGPGDSVVVVVNLASQPQEAYTLGLPAAGDWRVRLNSDWAGYDADFADFPADTLTAAPNAQDGQPARGTLSIGAYSVVILSQDPPTGT